MKYKHLIFDIDGTLVDNEKAVIATWQETIAQLFGKHYEIADLNFVLGISGETSMQRLGAENPKEAFKVWGENYAAYKSEIKLFPGIEKTISVLKSKGFNLGLVTSRTRDELENDYALCRIISNFDVVICVTDTPRPKPFADPILVYLKKTNTTAEDVIYIGDTSYDYQCAQNAGVDFGLVQWGDGIKEGIRAKYLFHVPTDILDKIVL